MEQIKDIIKQDKIFKIEKSAGKIQLNSSSKTLRKIQSLDKPIVAERLWPGEIDKQELREMVLMLARKFDKPDYSEEGSLKFQKARNIWENAIKENMSKLEFRKYIELFDKRKFYDSGYNIWQESDFFGPNMKVLYTRVQVEDLQEQTGDINMFGKMAMYVFDYNGKELIMYSFHHDLPYDKYLPKQIEGESMIKGFTEDELDLSKAIIKLQLENIELKDEIDKLNVIIAKMK